MNNINATDPAGSKTAPRVSAFLSVYNGEEWIEEALDSLLTQTETDFEAIVVDDGSTDGTKQLLDGYTDPRIRVISKENEGLGSPLNSLLRESRGTYIMRLDADDICMPDRMKAQADFLDANPNVVIVGSQVSQFTDSRVGSPSTLPLSHNSIVKGMQQSIHTMSHPTTMWRRSILDQVEGYLWDGPGEDWSLLLESARHGELANLPDVLYHRRLHPGSSSSTGAEGVLLGFAFARKRYERFLQGDPDYSREQFMNELDNGFLARTSRASRVQSALLHRQAQAEAFEGNKARGLLLLGSAAVLNPRVAAGAVWKLGRSYSVDAVDSPNATNGSKIEGTEPTLRVAQIVYDCIPDAGSDPGIGWHSVVAASGAGMHVHALTKASNRAAIEAAPPVPNVEWHYIDVPESFGPWRTGSTAGDTFHILRWLPKAKALCTQLAERGEIDLTHFVTFSAFWLPVPFADVPVPHVFGPAGGGERIDPALANTTKDKVAATTRGAVQNMFTKTPTWQRLMKAPDTVVVSNGRATTKRLEGRGADVYTTGVTGCLPDTLIRQLDTIEPIRNPETTLVVSGRQLRWKGHDLALSAMAHLRSSHPDATLEVLGSGPEHSNLIALAEELGITDRVIFRPDIDRVEERRRIAGADAFVFPSRRDTGSTLVPVVQVLGVPIVAFSTGAIPDSTGGFTYLADPATPPSPPHALADAMRRALEGSKEFATLGREHAIARHGEIASQEALRAVYNHARSER